MGRRPGFHDGRMQPASQLMGRVMDLLLTSLYKQAFLPGSALTFALQLICLAGS